MKNVKILLIVVLAFFSGIFGGLWGAKLFDINFANKLNAERVYVEESDSIDVIREVMPSVVSIMVSETSGGTGFIVSADGLIITNKHVAREDGLDYRVIFDDGLEYEAELISKDPFDDIAVLKIIGASKDFPVLKLGDSDELMIGQRVFVIGNALGLYGNTVTSGIISGKGRDIFAYDDLGGSYDNLSGLLQTDAAINLGNSGGPLVNMAGEVVGMSVAVDESANDIGFAIPVNDLKPVLVSIEKYGKIIRPVLGARFLMLTKVQAEEFNVGIDHGAILVSGNSLLDPAVIPGSAADEAGLKELDVILSVDSEEVDIDNPLHKLIRKHNPGDTVSLKVWSNGKEKFVDVVLGSSEGS